MSITTVGLDLAKNVFQVHGINAAGDVIVRRRLRRSQVREFFAGLKSCLIGMESGLRYGRVSSWTVAEK